MALNLTILGAKIAAHRKELRESVDQLGSALGIAVDRLTRIEAGAIEPTGDEILILSGHFLCDYKIFLTDEQPPEAAPTQILYRAKGDDFSKEDRRAIRDFLYLCETESELSNDLGRTTAPFQPMPIADGSPQIINAAQALREKLGYEENDLTRDVFGDCRRLGIHVFRRRLGDSDISGLFIVHPIAGKCILVNASEDIYRQRFSAAHELAHALFDVDALARVSLRTETSTPLESRANAFASAYLMPPGQLRQLPPAKGWSDEDAKRWANEFRVSCDALGIALLKTGLVDAALCKRIRALRVSAADKIDPEIPRSLSAAQKANKTALLEQGLSNHYVALCFEAHRQGFISAGRLAEALLRSPSELNEVAGLYGHKLHGH